MTYPPMYITFLRNLFDVISIRATTRVAPTVAVEDSNYDILSLRERVCLGFKRCKFEMRKKSAWIGIRQSLSNSYSGLV